MTKANHRQIITVGEVQEDGVGDTQPEALAMSVTPDSAHLSVDCSLSANSSCLMSTQGNCTAHSQDWKVMMMGHNDKDDEDWRKQLTIRDEYLRHF